MGPMARDSVPPGKLAAESLYEYALRALVRRSHTLAEIEAKLGRRAAAEEDVETVVRRLREHGYLDDVRVAESHSAIRREFHLLGRKRVLDELERRGVDASTAESAVEQSYEDCDEAALARAFLRRKLGSLADGAGIADRKRLAALYRALARAGFEAQAIHTALREVSADSEFLDGLAEAAE